MFYLKRIPWKGSVIISERLNTNHCQIQRWQNFVHICTMQHTSSWGARNEGITRYMFLRHGLDTWRKISSRHTKNCAPVFAIVSVLKLPLCGLVVFIDINTYRFDRFCIIKVPRIKKTKKFLNNHAQVYIQVHLRTHEPLFFLLK